MFDFLMVTTRSNKKGVVEVYPKFVIKKSKDLMIQGGDFYAIWIEERGLWSKDEQDAIDLIDYQIKQFADDFKKKTEDTVVVSYLWDASSGMIDAWHKYCQKQMRDNFHMLDETLIFANTPVNKTDYASKRLGYSLEEGSIEAWDKLISTLYSEEERRKIEWAIGSIVSGDSKKIQKFLVLYGAVGTGKSTILKIVKKLFDGYCEAFDAKTLGSSSNAFALEAFKSNPLVAIQHDGDLSRIEDNTRLNSLVSHETMIINEKFKSTYSNSFKCFLFMGTNKPVKITDAKSGLIRRLIDVTPSGDKLSPKEYRSVMKRIDFELGAIAKHCLDVYSSDPDYYENYIPTKMLSATNDFYDFVLDAFSVFQKEDGVSLKSAWEMYKSYCDEAHVSYPLPKRLFKEELKNYFSEYIERSTLDGIRVRNYYNGFITDKFDNNLVQEELENVEETKIEFMESVSIFDREYSDCPAQYASAKETPSSRWDNVKTKLSDLDTSKLHYVKVPENHIVIDFDIPDENGNKSFERNVKEASKWPPTYAELSKSGAGVHLHYIYTGDVSKLSRVYDDHIEVKIFTGKSSLRRKLTKCNNLPIASINSGLPLKGEDKVINFDTVKSERGLRTLIKRNLNKEIHDSTKCSVDFIYKILEDAYSSDLRYDVTDMRNAVLAFAASSTHQSVYCVNLVNKMQFKSAEASDPHINDASQLVFYDVEVFPNLFIVNWKVQGEGKPVVRMINPSPLEVEELMRYRLVGFNCRQYDNHILYARMLGYNLKDLYILSKRIVSGDRECFFGEAYNVSYTDVYDFAAKKQSLKKWEIELGIHHKELGLPWDEPVPKEDWVKVAEYCDNDVIATEAVFNHCKGDFTARKILADLAGMTVNTPTNTLTTRIIFGKERNPELVYTDLSTGEQFGPAKKSKYINAFPGYEYVDGHNMYRGVDLGRGGYVYAEPGMYTNVALLDVASLHPHSIIAMDCFGEYTKNFKDLVDARIFIKHGDYDSAREMLSGKLAPYLDDKSTAKDLAMALKIAINSVYGLTAASFENPFRDIRNKNNIVALRGALFMKTLQDEVVKRGFKVIHVKTDSIKIPDATPEIIDFCMEFAKQYGYTFEHEATYERICLVNDAVYIAKDAADGHWSATGAQFAVPYVFKKLFSKEGISFDDLCETKSVSTALYLDMNEHITRTVGIEEEIKNREYNSKAGTEGKRKKLNPAFASYSDEELIEMDANEHNYIFIGRIGRFCPVKEGSDGGLLMRKGNNGKYSSVGGTKGYRWLESEVVKTLGKEDDIDRGYYDELVNNAVDEISKYGDFEWFVSDDRVA